MNERIRQLAVEAGLRFTQLMSNPMVPVVDGRETDLEKFAQLIVEECIEQLEIGKRCDPYTGELFSCKRNDDIDYDITNLKEHFGVEE